jgi:hypothetical protein
MSLLANAAFANLAT